MSHSNFIYWLIEGRACLEEVVFFVFFLFFSTLLPQLSLSHFFFPSPFSLSLNLFSLLAILLFLFSIFS